MTYKALLLKGGSPPFFYIRRFMPRKVLDTRKSVVGYIAKGNKTPTPSGVGCVVRPFWPHTTLCEARVKYTVE